MMKKSKRILSLMAAVLLICTCLMFTACSCSDNDGEPDASTSPVETASATEATTEAVATTETIAVPELKLSAKYTPVSAYDAQGNQVSLSLIYGTAFLEYGGELSFTDNSYSLSMGASAKGPETGTYRITVESQVELTASDGDVVLADVNEVSESNTVTELSLPQGDYKVIFTNN
ncbi:MAG: hypothetical protein ACI4GZ_04950 [Ruminococcus sp.]